MIKLSRRSLLAGFSACIASVASPAFAAFPDLPTLYGDGIHDDAPAIQAIMDRKPVYLADGSLHRNDGMVPHLPPGTYIVNSSLVVNATGPVYQMDARDVAVCCGPSLPSGDCIVVVPLSDHRPLTVNMGGMALYPTPDCGAFVQSTRSYPSPAPGWYAGPTPFFADDGITRHYSA